MPGRLDTKIRQRNTDPNAGDGEINRNNRMMALAEVSG